MSPAKKPADHQPKAVKRLQAEAEDRQPGQLARRITLSGRRGEVTVAVLEDPMDWGIEATELIEVWQSRDPEHGGITAVEMRRFLSAVVSVEDADRIHAIEPTATSLALAADEMLAPTDVEPSLGESQAS